MFIGSLVSESSPVTWQYEYRRRGIDTPFEPDLHKDIHEGLIDANKGRLFGKERIGWHQTSLQGVGVDIIVRPDRACFIDRILIQTDKISEILGIEVLSEEADEQIVIGHGDTPCVNGTITVDVGISAQNLVVRIHAAYNHIIVQNMQIIGAWSASPGIYPTPHTMQLTDENPIDQKSITNIAIVKNASEDSKFAARVLCEKISRDTNLDRSMQQWPTKDTKHTILLGTFEEFEKNGLNPTHTPDPQGYEISISDHAITAVGADRNGLIYAVETLLSLIRQGSLKRGKIIDAPYKKVRGVHTGLPPKEEISFFKRLIRDLLAPMRYNTMFLEFAGGMRFDRHPKINEVWRSANEKSKKGVWPSFPHGHMVAGGDVLEKSEVAELVAYARSYGIEVIPEVQTLSHVQYITTAYPDLAETDVGRQKPVSVNVNTEDIPPSDFYAHSYCPLQQKSIDIALDLIDEITEVVNPREYVHIGHDEVYQIGVCPRCKDHDPAKLLADHVNMLDAHIRAKGLKTMMWADMLHDVTRYETPRAIDMISKEIVLLDFIWYFHLDKDLEDRLLSRGFEVIMGNMYSSHYPRYEQRIAKEGMLGAQVSFWCRTDEFSLASSGKLYDLMYSAQMMWNRNYTSLARKCYDRMITERIPLIRSHLRGFLPPSMMDRKKTVFLHSNSARAGFIKNDMDLSNLPKKGAFGVQRVDFCPDHPVCADSPHARVKHAPTVVEYMAEDTVDSIVFLHATDTNAPVASFKLKPKIGEYKIEYDNGAIETVEIRYGANIRSARGNHGEPMTSPYYRHEGYMATWLCDPLVVTKTNKGETLTFYGIEWINPHPDDKIHTIRLVNTSRTDTKIMVLGVSGIKTTSS